MLEETDFVVQHRPAVMEARIGYDVLDASGAVLATVEQIGRDNVARFLKPSKSDATTTDLELRDASGDVLLLLRHERALKSSVTVSGPTGEEIGRIHLENLVGKNRLTLESAGGAVGTMNSQNWRNKSFVVKDGGDTAVASIDMTRGSSGDFSHDNRYEVHVDQPLADPLRSLAVAGVFAIDLILWHRSS